MLDCVFDEYDEGARPVPFTCNSVRRLCLCIPISKQQATISKWNVPTVLTALTIGIMAKGKFAFMLNYPLKIMNCFWGYATNLDLPDKTILDTSYPR